MCARLYDPTVHGKKKVPVQQMRVRYIEGRLVGWKKRNLRRFMSFPSLQCAYCSREGAFFVGTALFSVDGMRMNFDHIVPRAKGGTRPNNLQITCYDCNHGKADLPHEEFLVLKQSR